MSSHSIGFTPTLPDGFYLPDGYRLEGECGEGGGRRVTLYFWCFGCPCGDEDFRAGPGETDKRTAIRQAWRDFRSGGTDPTAVDIGLKPPAAPPVIE